MAGGAGGSLQRGRGGQGRPHGHRLRRLWRTRDFLHRRHGAGAVPPRGRDDTGSVAAGVRRATAAAGMAMKPFRNPARLLLALAAMSLSLAVSAVDITVLPDEKLQQRYEGLTQELRCMQCMNNSIADSPVGLASDLRREVKEQLIVGKRDEQIRAYMVQRYGNVILFTPPVDSSTVWVWVLPVVAILAGLVLAVRIVRRRTSLVEGDDSPVETDESTR